MTVGSRSCSLNLGFVRNCASAGPRETEKEDCSGIFHGQDSFLLDGPWVEGTTSKMAQARRTHLFFSLSLAASGLTFAVDGAAVQRVVEPAVPDRVAVSDPRFVEVAAARNLIFTTHYGAAFLSIDPLSQMMQRNMGNGLAVGDYDNDGDLDVYALAQMGYPNRLFRNDLDLGSAQFTEVSAAAGVDLDGMSRAAVFVDLDNDGWKDLVVLNDDDGGGTYPASALLRNNGDGTFDDVTAGSGFDAWGLIRGGLAIADYDGDGLLDIYVSNWSRETGGGNPLLPGHNVMFRNRGGMQFENALGSTQLGILARDSFQAILHDLDEDDHPDLYVAIDHTSDEFYFNLGDGRFMNATASVGTTHTGNDMGVACGDFDADLDLDLYVTNITDPDLVFGTTQGNVLYVNDWDTTGSLGFTDQALARNVSDTYWGWGVKFTDVENDGDLDIVAATGFDQFVSIFGAPATPLLDSPMVLFVNDGDGNFTRDFGSGIGGNDDSRGLAAVDYDRDGDEDLIVTNIDEPIRLLENVSTQPGDWLTVRLIQAPGANRDGIGASVFYTVGSLTRRREMIVSDSYLTGSPAEIHIGLGSSAQIDLLTVRWSDGTQSLYSNVAANQEVLFSQATPDADLDGIVDSADCAAADATVWAIPGAVGDLRLFDDGGLTEMNWSRPADAGGLHLTYDLLRGTDVVAADATCLQNNISARNATDGTTPDSLFYYLVRAENGCGGAIAPGSGWLPRPAPSCP